MSTLRWMAALSISAAAAACAGSRGPIARQLELERPELTSVWSAGSGAGGTLRLGDYEVKAIGAREQPDAIIYGFHVSTDTGTVATVAGTGTYAQRAGKVVVAEVAGIAPSGTTGDRAWKLELKTSEAFQVSGTLTYGGESYELAVVPTTTLPMGDELGADAVCFRKNGHLEMAVDLTDANAPRALVRPGSESPVLAAAAIVVLLRRNTLRAAGSLASAARPAGISEVGQSVMRPLPKSGHEGDKYQ